MKKTLYALILTLPLFLRAAEKQEIMAIQVNWTSAMKEAVKRLKEMTTLILSK